MHKGNTSPAAHSADAPTESPTATRELDRVAGLVSRAYGMSVESAQWMILQLTGDMAARSLTTRSVDGVVCAPGFDLAIIGAHGDLIHGAQMRLLDAVLGEYQTARDLEAAKGPEVARSRHSSLISKHERLQDEKKAAEERLRNLLHVPKTPEEYAARRGELGTASEIQSERRAIEASIRSLTEESLAVQLEMSNWRFASAPGIVRDEGGWEKFPNAGLDSFDRNFLQLASATSLVQDGEALTSKWFLESVELLRRSRRESPFSVTARSRETTTCSMQITGDHFAFSRLFHDPRFSRAGFFSGFVLVEADAESAQCDADAIDELTADENWRMLLQWLLNDRLTNIRRRLQIDHEGVQCCLDFREWFTEFLGDLPEQHHWSFSGWPALQVEMAMGLAIIEVRAGGEVLETGLLRRAAELLKAHAPRQAALLDTLLPEEEVTDLFEERIERLVARLTAKGPLTKRALARCISGQNYGVIDTLLKEAVRRGLIVQREKLFVATGVNVNGSAGKTVIDFSRGVAA
jgi:hypothetical protein